MHDTIDVQVLATDLQFPEGPVALNDGSVLVAEIRSGLIKRVWPNGTVTTLTLRRGALPAGLPAHERVLWQVLALKGHDVMARSKTQPVDLP